MKRILILQNNAAGLYKFRKEIVKAFIDKGHSVCFSTPGDSQVFVEKLEKIGAKYYKISFDRRGINILEEIKIFFNYLKLIKKIRTDFVLTYTMKCNIYGSLAASILKVPYINTITGLGKPFENNGILKFFLVLILKIALKKSEAVFFQNRADMEILLNEKVVKKEQCVLVNGSGVNLKEFIPMNKTIQDDNLRILFIGRMVKHKGIEELLDVAENLKEKYKNVICQLLGPYDEIDYQRRITKLNLKGVTEYLGVSEDVREHIRNCDCVVLPSYTEGMSNALLESGALEKPLIASNIPGCREIILDGENGFLVKPKSKGDLKEKIEKFINLDIETRFNMGKRSRELISRKFDREEVLKSYMDKIFSVLSK